MQLDELLTRFGALPLEAKKAALADANAILGDPMWVANVGPQHEAYHCQADELFYGGQAGGGKSDLLLGLALTAHERSLILRRVNRDVGSLIDRTADILGTRSGYNGQSHIWRRPDGRTLEFGGCQYEHEKERYKGRPHDLKAFDELSRLQRVAIHLHHRLEPLGQSRASAAEWWAPATRRPSPKAFGCSSAGRPGSIPSTRGRPSPVNCAGTRPTMKATRSRSTAAART